MTKPALSNYTKSDSIERLASMPIVTTVLGKGHDVLLCDDNVDEFCMMALAEYPFGEGDGRKMVPLKNVAGEDLGLTTEAEKEQAAKATEDNATLFEAMAAALDGKVEKVVVSTRLTDAPVVITTEGAVSLKMAEMLKHAPGSEEAPDAHVVLEVNAEHPVFETLRAAQEAGEAAKVADYAGILYDQALLVEGLLPDDPVAFAQRIAKLMV